jgi:hypothetical protein
MFTSDSLMARHKYINNRSTSPLELINVIDFRQLPYSTSAHHHPSPAPACEKSCLEPTKLPASFPTISPAKLLASEPAVHITSCIKTKRYRRYEESQRQSGYSYGVTDAIEHQTTCAQVECRASSSAGRFPRCQLKSLISDMAFRLQTNSVHSKRVLILSNRNNPSPLDLG